MIKMITLLSLVLLSLLAKGACASPPEPPPCEVQLGKLKGAPLDSLAKAITSSGNNMIFQKCVGEEMLTRGTAAVPVLRKIVGNDNSREAVVETLGMFGPLAQSAIPDIINSERQGYCSQCATAYKNIGISGEKNVTAALNEVLRSGYFLLAELIYKNAPGFSDPVIEKLGAKMFQVQCDDKNNPYMGLLAHSKKPQAAEYLVRYMNECGSMSMEPLCSVCIGAISIVGKSAIPLLVKKVKDLNGSYDLPAKLDARTGEVDQTIRGIDKRLLAAMALSKVGGGRRAAGHR